MFRNFSMLTLALSACILVGASSAAADTVTPGNQIFSGKQCFGAACVDPEDYTSNLIRVKTTDTPGASFVQTDGGGFTAQTWDIAGNEANFFVRDVTHSSRLPFRIFPGAPTSSLAIKADGSATTVGLFVEETSASHETAGTSVNTATLLEQLKNVGFKNYEVNADSTNRLHFKPFAADLQSLYGLGNGTDIAPTDVSALALAGLQQLNAKVDALPQTPDSTTGLTAANAKIAALEAANLKIEAANKKMLKSLASLSKKVKKLSKRKK